MTTITQADRDAAAAYSKYWGRHAQAANVARGSADGTFHLKLLARHREQAEAEAADRIEALEAEVERLREALKPFARAEHIVASVDGDRVRCILSYPSGSIETFTLASLDAARAALGDKQ